MQYNLTVSGFFFPQPNIPARVFSLSIFLLVTFCATFIFYCAREAPSSLRLQSFSWLATVYVCMCVCVSPANVTVMLTGVAHEAIHLLQPQLLLLLWLLLLLPKAQAAAAKLLHQHFVCIRVGAAAHVCVCAPGVCLCLSVYVCVCLVCYTIICVNIYSARFSFNIKREPCQKPPKYLTKQKYSPIFLLFLTLTLFSLSSSLRCHLRAGHRRCAIGL